MEENFDKVIGTLKTIKDSSPDFAKAHLNSLDELLFRLEILKASYTTLEALNKKYLELDPLRMEMDFDPVTGIVSIKHKGVIMSTLQLIRADPEIPVQFDSKSDISSFSPSIIEENEEFKFVKTSIPSELESFYYNANKAWDLVEETLLKKKDSRFIGVKMVRNKLIEHTEKGDIFSFGASEAWGPSVKPTQLTSREEKFHDKGLRINSEEFIEKVLEDLVQLK